MNALLPPFSRKRVRLRADQGSSFLASRMGMGMLFGVGAVAAYAFGSGGLSLIVVAVLAGLSLWGFAGAAYGGLGQGKFGDVSLSLDSPVPLASELVAELFVPRGSAGLRTIHATVRCRRVSVSMGTGSPRPVTRVESVWENGAQFGVTRRGRGSASEIRIRLPADAPLSGGGGTMSRPASGVYWELLIRSNDIPGVDLVRSFRFPVVVPEALWPEARRRA